MRLFMNRGKFLEETYYSFSYSPIRDELGRVWQGCFVPSNDVTPKVIGTRRLRTLAELSSNALVEKTIDAACKKAAATLSKNPDDVPFALFYLTNDGRAALKEIAGLERADDLLTPAIVDFRRLSPPRGLAIKRGISFRPIPDYRRDTLAILAAGCGESSGVGGHGISRLSPVSTAKRSVC